jgi:hypothetical protein
MCIASHRSPLTLSHLSRRSLLLLAPPPPSRKLSDHYIMTADIRPFIPAGSQHLSVSSSHHTSQLAAYRTPDRYDNLLLVSSRRRPCTHSPIVPSSIMKKYPSSKAFKTTKRHSQMPLYSQTSRGRVGSALHLVTTPTTTHIFFIKKNSHRSTLWYIGRHCFYSSSQIVT